MFFQTFLEKWTVTKFYTIGILSIGNLISNDTFIRSVIVFEKILRETNYTKLVKLVTNGFLKKKNLFDFNSKKKKFYIIFYNKSVGNRIIFQNSWLRLLLYLTFLYFVITSVLNLNFLFSNITVVCLRVYPSVYSLTLPHLYVIKINYIYVTFQI